jgi:signal transduction histidine kinase
LRCGCGSLDRSLFADTALLTRALRGRWATSVAVFAALVPFFIVAIYSRSGEQSPDLSPAVRWGTSILGPLAALAAYAGLVHVLGRDRSAAKSWTAPLLWVIAGATSALVASSLRSIAAGTMQISLQNALLSAAFTVILMGVATIAVASFATRQRQMRVLVVRQERLVSLRADAESYAGYQSSELARVVERVVTPEIRKLRDEVSALDSSPGTDQLQQIYDEISRYSSDVVRGISHEIAAPSPSTHDHPAKEESGWRVAASLMGGARVNAPLTILCAFLLVVATFNVRCLGVTSVAVSAFVLITLALGSLGRFGLLTRAPWSLMWLTFAGITGFVAYRLVLGAGPGECTWATTPLESALGAITALLLFLGLTVVIAASMQAAERVETLEAANRELAQITRHLNRVGLVTREQVAELLHGPVQGRLAAVSLAIRLHLDALQRGEDPSLPELKRRVDRLLDETSRDLQRLGREPVDVSPDMQERLDAVARQWQGFLDLTIDVDAHVIDVLDGHPDAVDCLTRCLGEAVTNASRHGGARCVMARCRLEEGTLLVLDVVDDGTGVAGSPNAGMGLEGVAASGGVWQFEPVSGQGAHLRVTWIIH